MDDEYRLILEKTFGLDFEQEPMEIVEELEEEVADEKEFNLEKEAAEDEEAEVLKYEAANKENAFTGLCVLAGLLNEEFDRAERTYRLEIKEADSEQKFILE